MTDYESKFDCYWVRRLPPSIFGETYIIVSATKIPENEYLAEYSILTQRPKEELYRGEFSISANSIPPELGEVDLDFAFDEALRVAEIAFNDLLEKRTTELGKPDLALQISPVLDHIRITFLIGCIRREVFIDQLEDLETATNCPSLKKYIVIIRSLIPST